MKRFLTSHIHLSLFFALIISVGLAARETNLFSFAQTYPGPTVVMPILPKDEKTSDTLILRTFGFVTLTPTPLPQDTGASTSTGSATTTANGAPVWPLPKKSPAQYRRIDAGWDLQYHTKTTVHAVGAGKITIAGYDPRGFGVDYPLLTLDVPFCGYKKVYYGHVHVNRSVLNKHVNAGDVIAYTDPNGVNSPPNWVEPGFWGSNGPAGNGQAYPTRQGRMIKNLLLNNKCDPI